METDFRQLPISRISSIGEKTIQKLNAINIYSCFDLLLDLPRLYEDRSRVIPINQLQVNSAGLIIGTISKRAVYGRRLEYWLQDGTGEIHVVLFHFFPNQVKLLVPGKKLQIYGTVRRTGASLQIVHPEYKILKPNEIATTRDSFYAIYIKHEITKGVNWHKLVERCLCLMQNYQLNDSLTEVMAAINHQADTVDLQSLSKLNNLLIALTEIHQPPLRYKLDELNNFTTPPQQRLIFDEMLSLQATLALTKQQKKQQLAQKFSAPNKITEQLKQTLTFNLTNAQTKTINEIWQDLSSGTPMHRLLQGDVGSGKTIVSAFAIGAVIEQGLQTVIMAPTELLIYQHYLNFRQWFEPLNITVRLLTSKIKKKEQAAIKQEIADGTAQIILGTHALFQENVSFYNIGLLIIDEQQRFGVGQRLELYKKASNSSLNKSKHIHQLMLTATPIPRTMAMALFGDLNQSIIDELPPGRQEIQTAVIAQNKRNEIQQKIVKLVAQEQAQIYWVCPLIEDSEYINAKTVADVEKEFSNYAHIRIAVVHGKMKTDERITIMQDFSNHKIDVLIATTVIEVGVDVPNASVIIIDNAERMGLSQLHQLRGRVGRGAKASQCILLYQQPLSEIGTKRLNILRKTNDGFAIAEQDLKTRGAGEWLGTKQTGNQFFRICELPRDYYWLELTHKIAQILVKSNPKLCQTIANNWYNQKEEYSKI